MSAIALAEFDPELANCDMVTTKVTKPGDKARTLVKLSYGPSRRAIAFVTPPCVVDWPKLSGDGNYGSTYGPADVDKAQFTVGLTDKLLPDGAHQMQLYFGALRAIDDILVDFVHLHQKELLNSRGLLREEVKGKLSPTVKPKYDGDVLAYSRHNLSTRKFTWSGDERKIQVVDSRRVPLADEAGPIAHEDICAVATQLDCIYTGLMGSMYGTKWNVCEVMLLKAPQPGTDAFANYAIPAWADSTNSFQ